MQSVQHTRSFEIAQPIELLFPLFTPEGEKLWTPGWDYRNIMGTNRLSEDYVFLTNTHDHASQEAIWIVKKFEPDAHLVQYYKIEPAEKIGVVTVSCLATGPSRTRIEVTYRYIALSESGRKFNSNFTEADYAIFIGEWERLLNMYFQG